VHSSPAISVIMPVFNGAKTLERALDSLRVQSLPQWELLAVDDGSADDSFELLTRAAASEPRIRPFRLGSNRGPAAARNHGLVQARAEWISYLDCDDEYAADYLKEVVTWGGNADVLVFGYDLLEHSGEGREPTLLRTWQPAELYPWLFERNIATPLGIAHRRCLLERVGLFQESLPGVEEDWDLWKRFAAAGASFLFVPRQSGRYHIRPGSRSHRETSFQRVPETNDE
jgi:glycosyltransferase involved in cell wall biosynthesis